MRGRKPKYRYVIAAPGGPFAFIPHPAVNGAWLRVHACVLAIDCSHCKAKRGVPCTGADGNWVRYTHYHRRQDAQANKYGGVAFMPAVVYYEGAPKPK